MNVVNWLPRYVRAQKSFFDLPAGARVLDVACGEGDMARFLAGRGAKVWAGDLSVSEMRKGSARNQHPQMAFVGANACRLPFADESFDWIVSFDTLEVIPDDSPVYGEFDRVLKRGGVLLVTVPTHPPNAGHLFASQRALRRWLPRWLYSQSRDAKTGRSWLESRREDLVYFRSYTAAGLQERFAKMQLVEHDYVLKQFGALAMDLAYGFRGLQRLGLKPYLYWLGSRLDAVFCRGASHEGYTVMVKFRKS